MSSSPSEDLLFICVAHIGEARPLIASLDLRPIPNSPYSLFSRDSLVLIVTGQGAHAMAGGCGYAAGRFRSKLTAWLNVGLCGHPDAALGSVLLADKVEDTTTGDIWYPQFPFPCPYTRASLRTVSTPDFSYTSGAVDMEGAGFCRTAIRFSTLEAIHLAKVVSDSAYRPGKITPAHGEQLMEAGTETVLRIATLLLDQLHGCSAWMSHERHMDSILAMRHLTATQHAQMRSLLRRWHALTNDEPPLQQIRNAQSSRAALTLFRVLVENRARSHSLCP